MASSRTPKQILIMVNVTFPFGPQYTYLAFADGSNADPAGVGPGDQIGWFVRVQAGSDWSQPAYSLAFADPSVLGTSSISVPNGGSSGFFTVQALSGGTKYTLAVSGVVPVSDPEIQVDPNGVLVPMVLGATQFNVRWTVATNLMEVSAGGNPWTPFPAAGLTIAVGESVQFFAVLTPPANFLIQFPSTLNNNAWASPFDPNLNSFPATNPGTANENTANLTVADKSDKPGSTFVFVAALTDGSQLSNPCTFIMS